MERQEYEAIVVGAGHAGLEACFVFANLKQKVALITLTEQGIGKMPCNPSVGGPAKGIVTREIDALGGMQGKVADATAIQIKLLNTSKGPGVWAIREQCDKIEFQKLFIKLIKDNPYIDLVIDEATDLYIEGDTVKGVYTIKHGIIYAKSVILTTGTYLKSYTFRGYNRTNEGPNGLKNSTNLSESLVKLGFKLRRLKTGTPPRIYTDTIDFSKCQKENGTDLKICFSHFHQRILPLKEQIPCYLLYTNKKTHDIIWANKNKSAMYSGYITGIGPQYCLSIEDKVTRFTTKPRHQLFLEPESLSLPTMYLGDLSTSMPPDVQEQMIRSLPGLENCKVAIYGYAIEYDAIDPLDLYPTLESKKWHGLYFGGQINGTSGYEEAAGQGIMAGINAYLKIKHKKPLILGRDEAYIGVMIDDLTTKGILDPYRLLTSRAEYRLMLRNDNADDRLLKYGHEIGLINDENWQIYLKNKELLESLINYLKNTTVGQIKELNEQTKYEISNLKLASYLCRADMTIFKLKQYLPNMYQLLNDDWLQKAEINIRYLGYIKREIEMINNFKGLKDIDLSWITDYKQVPNIATESIIKLNKIRPQTIDQASRISGINFSDLVYLKYYVEQTKKNHHD